jgi:prevent-host-death family protein
MTEKTIPALEARNHLGEIIKCSVTKGDAFIVEKSGIPMIAIISVSDYEAFKTLAKEREKDFTTVAKIRSKMPDLSEAEIRALVSETIAEIRKTQNVKSRR